MSDGCGGLTICEHHVQDTQESRSELGVVVDEFDINTTWTSRTKTDHDDHDGSEDTDESCE